MRVTVKAKKVRHHAVLGVAANDGEGMLGPDDCRDQHVKASVN